MLSSASWGWHLLKHVWGTLPQHVNEPDRTGRDPNEGLPIHNKRALQSPTVHHHGRYVLCHSFIRNLCLSFRTTFSVSCRCTQLQCLKPCKGQTGRVILIYWITRAEFILLQSFSNFLGELEGTFPWDWLAEGCGWSNGRSRSRCNTLGLPVRPSGLTSNTGGFPVWPTATCTCSSQ